ncbi:hypothetical protein ED733_000642 [Metarhizium rileyi]|uniref:FAS1-like dehydratase domain-containing protein n=1 Tax=Metarhizium rileyi (strain RCEF 4871) TaxID=1649241 RepID=A0A5C6G6Z5_METRR|nr:hypothetical protein ED733_000642 [Metarhizium rileyi]
MRPLALRRIFRAKRAFTTSLPTSSSSSSSSPSPSSSSSSPTSSSPSSSSSASPSPEVARLLDQFQSTSFVRRRVLDGTQLQRLSLMLGRPTIDDQDILTSPPAVGTPIPPGHHLVYFASDGLERDLGPDGTDTTFNAPFPFTRRMWASGSLGWSAESVKVGDEVEEHTRLVSATHKQSQSAGEMILVEVEKSIRGPRSSHISDNRTWVFRPAMDASSARRHDFTPSRELSRPPSKMADSPAQPGTFPIRELSWSPLALFRFSALTFNAHKIHYDERWSQQVEGHPGLVVHGPLNMISILDYWSDIHGGGTKPGILAYRAMSPLYAGETYTIRTTGMLDGIYKILVERDGVLCMKSEVWGDIRKTNKGMRTRRSGPKGPQMQF